MILCDTDVFIEALKNNPQATASLRNIGFNNIALSAVTVMELYFGSANKQELRKIKNRLQKLKILEVSEVISKTATGLIEKYAKSHSLHVPDALIAATAICHRMELLTYNVQDFRFIKNLKLWPSE